MVSPGKDIPTPATLIPRAVLDGREEFCLRVREVERRIDVGPERASMPVLDPSAGPACLLQQTQDDALGIEDLTSERQAGLFGTTRKASGTSPVHRVSRLRTV